MSSESSETVCRLCLSTDGPIRAIANTPLQKVYEKLTNVSLNSSGKPMVACSFCFWQLRKCRKLMTRSLRADELLTKILETGASITRELIVMIDRTAYKLKDDLSIPPMELTDFITPQLLIEKEIKVETLHPYGKELNREELTSVGNLKLEGSEDFDNEKRDIQEDDNIIIKEVLSDVEDIMYAETEAVDDTDDEIDNRDDVRNKRLTNDEQMDKEGQGAEDITDGTEIEEIERQLEDSENKQVKGAVPVTRGQQRPTLAGTRDNTQHNNTLHNNTQHNNHATTPDTNGGKGDGNDNIKKHFECAECGKKIINKSNLKKHLIKHSNDLLECPVCRKKFFNTFILKIHARIHTGEKPFECGMCQKRFNQNASLERHVRIHTGEMPYRCAICQRTFKWDVTFNNHLRTHQGFESSRTHKGFEPFQCALCPKSFSKKNNLKVHLGVHSGQKPFKCVICQKTFNRKHHMVRHLKIHSGHKPFECAICEKKFTRKDHLKNHFIYVHSGEAPHRKC